MLLASFASACSAARERPTLETLEAALVSERTTIGRFAHQSVWNACVTVDSSVLVPVTKCASPPAPGSEPFLAIERGLAYLNARRDSAPSPSAFHAMALSDLAWHASDTGAVLRAIHMLEKVSQAHPNAAPVRNDVAVAYLVLAEQRQQLEPLLQALERVDEALAIDSTLAAALFNRALILDRLHLAAIAYTAWSRFLEAESRSSWRAEAATYREEARRTRDAWNWPSTPDSLLALERSTRQVRVLDAARTSAQQAREAAFAVLGRWSVAVTRHDSSAALRWLDLAGQIGAAIGSVAREHAVTDAVHQLTVDRRHWPLLATAYLSFGRGLASFDSSNFDEAERALDYAVPRLRSLTSPLVGWASFYHAASLVSVGRYRDGERTFEQARHAARSDEYTLVAKIYMGLGVSDMRQSRYEPALHAYEEASRHLKPDGDRETRGWLHHLRAEAAAVTGQAAARDAHALEALRELAPLRASNHLNNELILISEIAQAGAHLRARADIEDESIAVAHSVGKPELLAWAYCSRAEALIALSRTAEANADLARAGDWLTYVPAGRGHDRIAGVVLVYRGQIQRRQDPREGEDLLRQAVSRLDAFPSDLWLPRALNAAGEAAYAAGDTARARHFLERSFHLLEGQASAMESTDLRARFGETIEQVSDDLMRLDQDAKDYASAFEHLERARAAAWPPFHDGAGTRATRTASVGALSRATATDDVVLDFAVLPDRILTWAIARGHWRANTVSVSRDSLATLVGRLETELDRDTVTASDVRIRLFDLLLRPFTAELAGARRLTVIADRELNEVPFGALWDRETRQFAIERFQLRSAPGVALLDRASRVPDAARLIAAPLVVGVTEHGDVDERPTTLLGALDEAKQIAQLYHGSTLILGGDAQRSRIRRLLASASMLHFAGHAIANAEQPELSYLALTHTSADDGKLYAREISRLQFSNLQLVVLSACNTLGTRVSRGGGIAGLSSSFMRAGAPAVISAMWEVDDQATAQLLVGFHERLAHGTPVPVALRTAQLASLRSQIPKLRRPRTWASFTYTGP